MSSENTGPNSPIYSGLRVAFVLQEWFHLLTLCVLSHTTNVPYQQLSALKKQSYIWWCHKTSCLLLLWMSSSRTLLCSPIRWTPTGDRRSQNQAILPRCVNLRKEGMTCQNQRATYCNINSKAPNIRPAQSISVALNIQIYERAKAMSLKSLWLP